MHEPHANHQRKSDPRPHRDEDDQHDGMMMAKNRNVTHLAEHGDYI
jgi:hypothetical protein